jgi:hypothetical protein
MILQEEAEGTEGEKTFNAKEKVSGLGDSRNRFSHAFKPLY